MNVPRGALEWGLKHGKLEARSSECSMGRLRVGQGAWLQHGCCAPMGYRCPISRRTELGPRPSWSAREQDQKRTRLILARILELLDRILDIMARECYWIQELYIVGTNNDNNNNNEYNKNNAGRHRKHWKLWKTLEALEARGRQGETWKMSEDVVRDQEAWKRVEETWPGLESNGTLHSLPSKLMSQEV